MALDILSVLRSSADRVAANNGLVLAGSLFVALTIDAFLVSMIAWTLVVLPTAGIMLLAPILLGIMALITGLLTVAIWIVAVRTFAMEATETIDWDHVDRGMWLAVLNLVVGAVIYALVAGTGFLLLVVPGVYVMVGLLFWPIYVARDDASFIVAMTESWERVEGQRLQLFGLLFGLFIAAQLVRAAAGFIAIPLGETAGFLLQEAALAAGLIYAAAVLTATEAALPGDG